MATSQLVRLAFLAVIAVSFWSATTVANEDDWVSDDEFDDVVVIEASLSPFEGRKGRQLQERNQSAKPPLVVKPNEQPCTTKDNRRGECKSLKECYPYFKLFELDPQETWVMGSHDTCSYLGPEGKYIFGVCCAEPKSKEEIEAEDEEAKKEEEELAGFPIDFSEINQNCGARSFSNEFRIVNGQLASVHEFPFMAAMLNRERQFCGGSLIDDKHILTAAHCVAHMSKYDVQNLKVVLGDHNLKESGETRGTVLKYPVKRVIRHKRFDATRLYNDVAILTLDKPVSRSNTIQPICIALDDSNTFEGQSVEVAGWGTTVAGSGKSSDILRKVRVQVWNNGKCGRSYGSDAPGGITDTMLCASLDKGSYVQDSCSGDSGGPLFDCVGRNGPCTQIGIVSWGISCAKAEYPGVYTRVTSFKNWIAKIVRKY